jgi:GntR family transcriptional repressor for pyruvate dehydrogenase complex
MSRLHEHLMRVLISDIANARFAPGEPLPREADLASQFGVSRGVARECLRGLEERGLVRVKHGRGATVNADDRWDVFDPDVLGALLRSDHGTAILREYLECRRILEIEAVGLAAERATEQDLAALSDAFARMSASAERARGNPAAEDLYHQADIAFHRAVIAATGNRALGNMTEPIHRALGAARRPLARPQHRIQRSLPEHRRILAAIAGREPEEARLAMEAHLVTVEGYLREFAEAGGSSIGIHPGPAEPAVEGERHGRP